jgi:hypothetical protein
MNCWIHGNALSGLSTTTANLTIIGNLICDNTGDGLNNGDTNVRSHAIIDNTSDGNGGDGIDASADQDSGDATRIFGNIISNNGTYGIRGPATESGNLLEDFNNFYQNTSGARLNVTAGANSLAIDPQFTNRAGFDYSIGTNLKAAGWLGTARTIGGNGSATFSYRDMGAAQREEPAGGSGGGPPANLLGGIFQ